MKKHWITKDGFVLEENKTYLWSGRSENLYTIFRWRDEKFKVMKVLEDGVTIYDHQENRMMDIDDKYLMDNDITLKKRK